MEEYNRNISLELNIWKSKMMKDPSLLDILTTNVQTKINSYIPEKIHKGITAAIRPIVKTVLFGSTYTTSSFPLKDLNMVHREALIKQKIENYCKTGAAEGGITGAGGFLMSLADFPILIGIKFKLLFEIASLYGFDVKDYKERLYILHVFQLAFSSKKHQKHVYMNMLNWDEKLHQLPDKADNFDWRTFQQEYRDYIDLAKLAQLLPVVGAAVGAVANYQLIKKLGKTAMQAYRLRLLKPQSISS